jgi:hypothetical protein
MPSKWPNKEKDVQAWISARKKNNPVPWSTESQADHTQYSLEHRKQKMLQTQKTSTNVESKEDDIEVEQSIGNHVEDGCFLALLLPPNTLRGLELLGMLPLKSICRTRTHQTML